MEGQAMDQMNELAFYTLAGAPDSPRDLIAEVHHAEALGIGAAFISERLNIPGSAVDGHTLTWFSGCDLV